MIFSPPGPLLVDPARLPDPAALAAARAARMTNAAAIPGGDVERPPWAGGSPADFARKTGRRFVSSSQDDSASDHASH